MSIPHQEAVRDVATELFEKIHGNFFWDMAKAKQPLQRNGTVEGCFDLFAYGLTGLTAWSNGLFSGADFRAWADYAGRLIAEEDLEQAADSTPLREGLAGLLRGLPQRSFLGGLGLLAETPDLFHSVEDALPQARFAAAEGEGFTGAVGGGVQFIRDYQAVLEEAGLDSEIPEDAFPYLIAGMPGLVAEAGQRLPG
ncbi:hypothetical protein [Thiohalorhabdus methylotrophus]|uniref:Uncharacterized protein n=1 Tax=Thiohalorhabdus methylotrophus TaxID=3242694 RepID=A0ABV4U023_9GAMM